MIILGADLVLCACACVRGGMQHDIVITKFQESIRGHSRYEAEHIVMAGE